MIPLAAPSGVRSNNGTSSYSITTWSPARDTGRRQPPLANKRVLGVCGSESGPIVHCRLEAAAAPRCNANLASSRGNPVGRQAPPVTYVTPEDLIVHQRDDALLDPPMRSIFVS